MEFDRGDGVVDLVRESRGHAAQRGEPFGLKAGAAFIRECGARVEVGACELADFVGPVRFGQCGFGCVVGDSREALRESAQGADDSVCQHPDERERKQPESTEHGKRAWPPQPADTGCLAEEQQAHLLVDRSPQALAAGYCVHFPFPVSHRLGERFAFFGRHALAQFGHRLVSCAFKIYFHPEHFTQGLRCALRRGEALASDKLSVCICRRDESRAGFTGLLELQPCDQRRRADCDKCHEGQGEACGEALGHKNWRGQLLSISGYNGEHYLSFLMELQNLASFHNCLPLFVQ